MFGEFSLYVCTGTHTHMCVHICRCHRITSGVIPQVRPSFETRSAIGPELCLVGGTVGTVGSTDTPVLFSLHHWNFNQKPSHVASLWALNSSPHTYKVCTLSFAPSSLNQ